MLTHALIKHLIENKSYYTHLYRQRYDEYAEILNKHLPATSDAYKMNAFGILSILRENILEAYAQYGVKTPPEFYQFHRQLGDEASKVNVLALSTIVRKLSIAIANIVRPHLPHKTHAIDNILLGLLLAIPRDKKEISKEHSLNGYWTKNGDFGHFMFVEHGQEIPCGRLPRMILIYFMLECYQSFSKFLGNVFEEKNDDLFSAISSVSCINLGTNKDHILESLGYIPDSKNKKKLEQSLDSIKATTFVHYPIDNSDYPMRLDLISQVLFGQHRESHYYDCLPYQYWVYAD